MHDSFRSVVHKQVKLHPIGFAICLIIIQYILKINFTFFKLQVVICYSLIFERDFLKCSLWESLRQIE